MTRKTIFFIALMTLLAGCSSAPPQAPKTEKELIESNSILHVPVDVSKFTAKKLNIVADNGDKGRITVFTNPADGKMYDADGQPVNEKGERILTDGSVCNPKVIVLNARGYGPGMNPRKECWSNAYIAYVNNDSTEKTKRGAVAASSSAAAGAMTAIAGPIAIVGVGAVLFGTMLTEHEITDDMPDTL